ncbi:hypothetical protein HanRHA438_Chr13g0628271 [Helianthus annuus]|nr:hypothetical protein HanRHA438_Chr13g0628271 [Helianthus annuus]
MLETVEPYSNRSVSYFLFRSIMKKSLDQGQFSPQILELGVNTLSTSIPFKGFISKLLKYEFDKGRSSSISHC